MYWIRKYNSDILKRCVNISCCYATKHYPILQNRNTFVYNQLTNTMKDDQHCYLFKSHKDRFPDNYVADTYSVDWRRRLTNAKRNTSFGHGPQYYGLTLIRQWGEWIPCSYMHRGLRRNTFRTWATVLGVNPRPAKVVG